MIIPECLPHPHHQLPPDFVNDLKFKFHKSILQPNWLIAVTFNFQFF